MSPHKRQEAPERASTTGYFIDSGSETEIVRLLDQDHAVTRELGLFPVPVEELFPSQGEEGCRVLDLACGPGGWAGDVALRLPEAEVIGVDVARAMVRYATMRATSQQRANVRFSLMDITRPFSFPDAFFHYVQARFLVGFMRPEQWQPLVQECMRVLVPGGTLCLIESEWPLTTSPAYEQLTALTAQALHQAGRSLAPDGRHFGVTPRLSGFLRQAGFQDIGSKAVALDWSQGCELHASSVLNARFAFALLQPFVLTAGLIDEAAFGRLYERMLDELESPDFGGLATPLIAWGRAPRARGRGGERRGDREAQEPREVPTGRGDTRPSFLQVLERHHLTCEQVAEQAGIAVADAQALANGQPVFVGSIDVLLTALSLLTGQAYSRLTVGHLHVRFDARRVTELGEASS